MILCREYDTPAGALCVEVRKSEDWPYGDHVPFIDDHMTPRSLKFIIEEPRDLEALQYLLVPTPRDDIEAFREYAAKAKAFARKHGIATLGGWGVGADMLAWLTGLEQVIYMGVDQPEFLRALTDMIAAWNRERMEVVLDAGVDMFVRRGWYETTDFWSPALYREYLRPVLKDEAALAHSKGARFAYINTSSNLPLLADFAEAGVDVLLGVDPAQGDGDDMATIKESIGSHVALWGGVNGFLTVEMGDEADVESAVNEAFDTLGPGGGFILSPVDNVTDSSPATWRNVAAFIEAWKARR